MGKKRIAACVAAGFLAAGMLSGLTACGGDTEEVTVTEITDFTNEEYVNTYGRIFYNENIEGMTFVNSASGFEVRFTGTELKGSVWASVSGYTKGMFSVFVDGDKNSNARVVEVYPTAGDFDEITFVEGLPEGEHTVKVLKRTPSNRDVCIFESITTDGSFLSAPARPAIKLDIYGDSITCGEGVMREVTYNETTKTYEDSKVYTADTQNVFQSYAGVASRELDAEFRVFGRGGIAMKYAKTGVQTVVENYKSMAVDMSVENGDCPEYDYNSYFPDAVVIYLGTNDYARRNDNMGYSLTGLQAGFIEFIDNVVGTYYCEDMPIFLCYGLMVPDSGLDRCMESVKASLISKYPNIDTVAFEAGITAPSGHPCLEESEVAGKLLAEKIRAKLEEL